MTVQPKRWLGLGLVVLASFFWSTAGVFVTTIARGTGISALGLAFWRVLGAGASLLLAIMVAAGPGMLRVKPRDLLWLGGMGVLAVGTFQVLWILAILTNGASVATVIQCNAPIIVTLLARLIWKEPLTWPKWTAIGLATLGTILVSGLWGGGNLHITPLGLVISLGSAISYAGITLFSKKLSSDYNPFVIMTYSFGFAALALLPFQIGRPLPDQATLPALVSYAGLVLFTTIAGYGVYLLGLRHLQASVAAIVAMAEVPFASFLAYVVLDERLNAWQVVGAAAVICGVAVLSLRTERSRRVEREARSEK